MHAMVVPDRRVRDATVDDTLGGESARAGNVIPLRRWAHLNHPGPVDTTGSDGFAAFYRAQSAPMTRLAFLLVGSQETAQDLVQDAFVRVHAKWSSIDEPQAYLRRAVVNACNSHHRRGALERRVNAATVPRRDDRLDADELSDALATLPYRQRAVLVLRFYHDLSEAEIASTLGVRPGTVGSLASRALAQLRTVIER